MPIKSLHGHWAQPVEAKTADYTVLPKDGGKLFTNRGAAGTVVFTLPSTSGVGNGWWCEFSTVAAQAVTIATSPTDTLVVHANATADSVTSAATIGQHFRVINDGTGFLLVSNPSAASAGTAVTAITITDAA